MLAFVLSAICCMDMFAQTTISGIVSDELGALPGVNVMIKGTTVGTITGDNGEYSISATPGQVLVFSFIGYSDTEVTVGDRAKIDVTMYEDSQKGKYALNSRIYYPTTSSKAVLEKFEKLSVTTDTDVYMVKNIPNSGRFDVHKLVPDMYDSFFKDVSTSLNNVMEGKDDGSGMNESIIKWNKTIKSNIDNMNSEIKKVQASFNKTHK